MTQSKRRTRKSLSVMTFCDLQWLGLSFKRFRKADPLGLGKCFILSQTIKIKAVFFLIFFLSSAVIFLSQSRAQEQTGITADTQGLPLKSEVSYGAENLRDPFKSPIQPEMLTQPDNAGPSTPEVPLPTLKVQGVFWGASFPQAIINDKVVKTGDTVDGARIVSIEKDFVTVFFVNRQYKISSPASDNLPNSSKPGK